jgi:cell division protein FtsL
VSPASGQAAEAGARAVVVPVRVEPRADGARHLRIVVPEKGRGAKYRSRLIGALVAAGLLVVVFGLVGVRVLADESQLSLDRLQPQVVKVESRYQTLRLRVDELEAPSRIVSVAEGRLGMRPPTVVTYLSPVVLPAGGRSSSSTGAGPSGARTGATRSAGAATLAPQGSAAWPVIKAEMGDAG